MRFKPGDVIYRGPERPPFRYLGKSNKEGTDPLREIEFRGEDRRGEGTLVFCDLTTGSKESRIWWQCSDSGLDADADVLRDWIVVELRPDDKVVIIPSTETVPIGHQTSDGVIVTQSVQQTLVIGYRVEVLSPDGSRRIIEPRRPTS